MHDLGRMADEELAELTRSGNERAYGELWQRHSRAGRAAARQFASLGDPDDLVSEAYLQILRALQRGGGPREAFRPYLYRTIRNVALNKKRDEPVSLDVVGELGDDGANPEIQTAENTITVRAFRTLPERWQTVLWYTEVEGMEPAEAAPLLGLSANSVAALAYRAREGLKKAWLQAHVNDERVPPGCRWTTERMGDYVRGALSDRAKLRFDQHLEECTRCSILVEEVDDVSRRLAVVLFPVVLGGSAAAGLLAERGGHTAGELSASAPRTPSDVSVASSRPNPTAVRRPARVAIVAAAAAGILAIAGGAFAASGGFTPSSAPVPEADAPAPAESEGDDPAGSTAPHPTADPAPEATPTPPPPPAEQPPSQPVRPRPPRVVPPTTPPAVPPVNPTDTVPPIAPIVTAPLPGALGNDATPTLTGSGEPGARIDVERVIAGTPMLLGSAIVGADGVWTFTPAAAIPDGTHDLRVTQVDAAGNRSPLTAIPLAIDTVALPPVIDSAALAGAHHVLPDVTGTAEPGATVQLQRLDGTALGAPVVAAADATWSIRLVDPGMTDIPVTAVQTDVAGNSSAAATATPVIDLVRPDLISPVDGATIPSAGAAGTQLTVTFDGEPGMSARVSIDGAWTATTHQFTGTPLDRVTPLLADGEHTIGVLYFDPATGRLGSMEHITFTIGP